ncbi:monovalent cation/H(+) antiporter subunit G [Virgibacillus xinjiangensis]|uniref:Monovalent cation/H(+) antiporter subunit G n=1 Tax=Virgibacillus xinjiangensis TaxID=393090 RepID=A0ABV7CRW9_9BACI
MIETWSNIIINIITIISLLLGTFFTVSAAIGVVRFPDLYTRLHAATKAATLGVASILIGAFLFLYFHESIVSGKLLVGIVFILLTAPVGAHMLGRAAHAAGIKPILRKRSDAYQEAIERKKLNNH